MTITPQGVITMKGKDQVDKFKSEGKVSLTRTTTILGEPHLLITCHWIKKYDNGIRWTYRGLIDSAGMFGKWGSGGGTFALWPAV